MYLHVLILYLLSLDKDRRGVFYNKKEVRINANVKKKTFTFTFYDHIDRSIDHCAARFDLKIDTDSYENFTNNLSLLLYAVSFEIGMVTVFRTSY